ncbi:hypothetical protein ACFO28_12940, partial [Flavobacterium buctense]
MSATAPTDRTIDVTLTITANTNQRFGGYQAGINFNTAIINGGTISAAYVPNSKSPELAAMIIPTPGVATAGHIRLSLQALSGANGVDMAQGTTLTLGTYKITNTVAWTTGSNANLWLQNVLASGKTNSLVNGYPFGLTTPATSYTTTAPVAGSLALGYTQASPLSLFLNASTPDCATLGNAVTTPVTCFAGTDGTATITLSALTPSVPAITYTIDGGLAQNATLVNGSFTITGLAVGTYSVVISNAGCPDLTVPVTISGPTTPLTNVTNESACDSYLWSVTGLTYTSSGSYNGTSVNGSGCVVNETLNLTITNNPLDYANLQFPASATICEGSTLTAYGQVYELGLTEAPGQAPGISVEFGLSTTNTNPATWTNWSSASFNVQVGNNDEYLFTTNSALASGTYYYTFRYAQTGCTGWQYGGFPNGFWNGTTQNSGLLTITPSTSNTITATACDTYTWSVNGTIYTASGTYTSVVGCHTETLNLTITPSTSNTTTATACDTYTWSVNGTIYTASGTYTSVVGCHTETLNLTITPSTSNTTTATACDTYTWSVNGTTYTASGT